MGFVAIGDRLVRRRQREKPGPLRRAGRLGDVVTCKGRVLGIRPPKNGDSPSLVDLELWAENQKGEKVITGKATAALPSRA